MPVSSELRLPWSNDAIELRRFSVAEYHRLAEVGILTDEDHVELLEGLVSPKMVHSPIHDATVSIIDCLIRGFVATHLLVRIQSSITLATSEPEPDLALVQGPPSRYARSHPSGADILHLIEVAESSITRDRLKASTYAGAGIPVYWIVNLRERCIEAFLQPESGVYQDVKTFHLPHLVELPDGYLATRPLAVSEFFVPDAKIGGPKI